jgi:hypothetical protein
MLSRYRYATRLALSTNLERMCQSKYFNIVQRSITFPTRTEALTGHGPQRMHSGPMLVLRRPISSNNPYRSYVGASPDPGPIKNPFTPLPPFIHNLQRLNPIWNTPPFLAQCNLRYVDPFERSMPVFPLGCTRTG